MADEVRSKLKEHFQSPKRLGEIENPDGTGIVGNARCGEILTFQIQVEQGKINRKAALIVNIRAGHNGPVDLGS